jgi:hypothetical protein
MGNPIADRFKFSEGAWLQEFATNSPGKMLVFPMIPPDQVAKGNQYLW